VQTVADAKLRQQPLLDATKKMTTHNTQTRKGFRWLCALVTVITLALPHLAFGFFDEDEPNIVIIIQQSQAKILLKNLRMLRHAQHERKNLP
jgi:hypothetical protein